MPGTPRSFNWFSATWWGELFWRPFLFRDFFAASFIPHISLLKNASARRVKSAAALTFLVTRALAEGVRIAAVATVVHIAFGTGGRTSVIVILLVTLVYTWEGGMKAVIWTDVIQTIIYLGGSAAAFFLLLHRIPGGWGEISAVAAAAGNKLQVWDFHFSLTNPAHTYGFWAGVIGGTFLTMASHGTDQTIVQRLLAARSQRQSQAALLASAAVVLVQFGLFLVLGVMLFAVQRRAAYCARAKLRRGVPYLHRHRHADRIARVGTGGHFCRRDVQRERIAEFDGGFERGGFSHAARRGFHRSGTAAAPLPLDDAGLGRGAARAWAPGTGARCWWRG